MHKNKQIQLPPPQVYEMARLRQMPDIDSLVQFAKQRAKLGMTLFYNIYYKLSNGHTILFPGDLQFETENLIFIVIYNYYISLR